MDVIFCVKTIIIFIAYCDEKYIKSAKINESINVRKNRE